MFLAQYQHNQEVCQSGSQAVLPDQRTYKALKGKHYCFMGAVNSFGVYQQFLFCLIKLAHWVQVPADYGQDADVNVPLLLGPGPSC